ncbi:uncharacterized protein ACIQIH_007769 isoform 1-T1 [Cyanocitta cristata]
MGTPGALQARSRALPAVPVPVPQGPQLRSGRRAGAERRYRGPARGMRSARPAAFFRRDGGALTGAAVPAGWGSGCGEEPDAARAGGRGRGAAAGKGAGLGLLCPEPVCAPRQRCARGETSGRVRGWTRRSGARARGKRDVVEKGARRCSGTWNPHQCFPNVLAETRPWGSCREGCPAQLRRMGLPRLSSPGGRATCSRPVLPVQFGNSTGDGPRGSAWDAAPAGAALGTVAREDEPRDTGDAAAAVPRRAGGPASRRLPGMGLGEASTRRLARLRSPMEEAGLPAARSSSSATSAPGSESGLP